MTGRDYNNLATLVSLLAALVAACLVWGDSLRMAAFVFLLGEVVSHALQLCAENAYAALEREPIISGSEDGSAHGE